MDLLAAYGSPNATVGFLSSSSSKVNFKNPPKIWKFEFDYLQQVLSSFQQNIKLIDLKDNTLCRFLGSPAATNANGKVQRWKSQRSYFVTDSVSFVASDSVEGGKCKVIVSGCLRGVPLYAHSLIQICGVGIGRIVSIAKGNSNNVEDGMEENATRTKIFADTNQQDSLDSEAVGDDLIGEQTWPTEEELKSDMITGEDEEEQTNDIDHTDDEGELEGEENEDEEDVDAVFNRKTIAGRVKPALNAHIVRYSNGVEVEGVEDDGDDFVEVPGDMSARQRFARYRALQSFRSSYWHPQENLPASYRRIFQLEDVKGMQRRLENLVICYEGIYG